MPALEARLKTALDETRLLILGAEILLGFHLNGAFQDAFGELRSVPTALHAAAFFLMALTVGLLIAPSMQHRLVEDGHASERVLQAATILAGCALLPFALSLGIDLFIVIDYRAGATSGVVAGAGFTLLAMLMWFGLAWLRPQRRKEEAMTAKPTPIDERVEHMLTEARVLLPGAQALLGFQLAVMLTKTFGDLPSISKVIHVAALCCIATTVILLMTPASIHRIAYGGENTEGFHRIGSALVIAAAFPLAAGIAGDLYVAVAKGLQSTVTAAILSLIAGAVLLVLWIIYPYALRHARGRGEQ